MMAASAASRVVDPTRPSKYPIILSDALLGKSTKEVFTAMKYNHKPRLSSDTAPNSARLKPSSSNNGSFDLTFTDDGGKYAYTGNRSTAENQYVLVFDPDRKAFILHRLDSTFNMNLTRTPSNNDPESLKQQHPHIESSIKVSVDKKGVAKVAGKTPASKTKEAKHTKQKPEKKDKETPAASKAVPQSTTKATKATAFVPPSAPPPKPKPEKDTKKKRRDASDSEEDSDSDDGGLQVEYPEGEAPPRAIPVGLPGPDGSPAFPSTMRRFSEFARDMQREESDEDADAEYDEDDMLGEEDADGDMDPLKLPSPLGQQNSSNNDNIDNHSGGAADEEPDIDNLEDDLEAELEKELAASGMDVDSESSVSEED